jgi:polar amino acid transport system permease protein
MTVKPNDLAQVNEESRQRSGYLLARRIYKSPYWLLLFVVMFLYVAVAISNEGQFLALQIEQGIPAEDVEDGVDHYRAWMYVRGDFFGWVQDSVTCIFGFCPENHSTEAPPLDGIYLTLVLAIISYTIAMIIGLLVGIVRASPPEPPLTFANPIAWVKSAGYTLLYNVLTFYVEFMRGIPSLVFVLLAGFVILPAIREAVNTSVIPALNALLGSQILNWNLRAIDPTTGILSLALIYGAYLSEIFRAGIQGIHKGQFEAARSLGMTQFQTMYFIVIPQAIRAILPPLGNDFIAIIKDTALLTILGVNEITQLARKWVGITFTYPETYLILSVIYLGMTITGSLMVQAMERYLRRHER